MKTKVNLSEMGVNREMGIKLKREKVGTDLVSLKRHRLTRPTDTLFVPKRIAVTRT